MQKQGVSSVGKRGRQIEVQNTAANGGQAKSYTPEYHEAKAYEAYVKNTYALYKEDDLTNNDRRQLANARDAVESERQISDIAARNGYSPSRMTKQEWSELADKLLVESKRELSTASEVDRQAAGDKLRGKKDRIMEVGGQPTLVRSGASRKDARQVVSDLNRQTRTKADDYLSKKLVDYGYNSSVIDPLNYNQKRKLMAEIGHGERQTYTVAGISNKERDRVISNTSEMGSMAAKEVSLNPRAAKGLETWGYAMQAAEKADRYDLDTPPEYIYDRESAPAYVEKNIPARRKEQEDFIDF